MINKKLRKNCIGYYCRNNMYIKNNLKLTKFIKCSNRQPTLLNNLESTCIFIDIIIPNYILENVTPNELVSLRGQIHKIHYME